MLKEERGQTQDSNIDVERGNKLKQEKGGEQKIDVVRY